MGESLFFSGSHNDHSFIRPLIQRLNGLGYTTWWFMENQYPGLNYRLELRKRIEHCRAVVLVLSKNSVASEEVDAEVYEAKQWRRPIIPIRLDLNDGLVTYDSHLRRLVYIDARDNRDPLPELLKALELPPVSETELYIPYLIARGSSKRLLKPDVYPLYVPPGASTPDPFTVCTIGRDHIANNIVVLDPGETRISRIHHARISAQLGQDGCWQFILQPKPGKTIYLNGESLAEDRELKDGALIALPLKSGSHLELFFTKQEISD